MNDAEAFLAAIRDQPDEVAPRLVFADWLDEQGDPLGEFIRLSVEWETLPVDCPTRPAKAQRLRQLRYQNEEWWVNPIRDVGGCDTVVRRGFVEEVTVDLETLLRRSKRLFSLAPLRTLRVQHDPGPLTPIYLQQLAMLRPIRTLACLDLSPFPIPELAARRLAKTPGMKKLPRVRLANTFGPTTLEELHAELGKRLELVGR